MERVQGVLEGMVSQAQMKRKDAKVKKEKKMAAGWSTKKVSWRKVRADGSSKTLKKWCSGGASARRKVDCGLHGRKINFTNSKTLVGVATPTATRVTFDLPDCENLQKTKK